VTYGALPKWLGVHQVECREFMFYQYLPVKLSGHTEMAMEQRLECFRPLLGNIACDYVGYFGLNMFVASYVYVTAKRMYQMPGCPINRPGWHSDGFGTDDINYIWSDCCPTVFNNSNFVLSDDDEQSMRDMARQADESNNVMHPDGSLLRLDSRCIHRAADCRAQMLRTFLKVSFSPDRYDLAGNSRNHLLKYDWPMRERRDVRNTPQAPLP